MEVGANYGKTLDDLTVTGSQRVQSRALGQQDFLKLLIEQMRNQNPLEPQDNAEFITQLATFDTLNAMHEMTDALKSLAQMSELANASALVGRTVVASVPQEPDSETGMPREPELVEGVVDRVTFGAGGATVHIGNRALPASIIEEVR
jgi:flagellar basal-body rod modification protein FlgD